MEWTTEELEARMTAAGYAVVTLEQFQKLLAEWSENDDKIGRLRALLREMDGT